MTLKKYKIKNTNLLHDGNTYKIGSIIELDENQAKKLEDVLTYVSDVKTTATKTTETKPAETKTAKTSSKATTKTETPADSTKETGEAKAETKTETIDGGNK